MKLNNILSIVRTAALGLSLLAVSCQRNDIDDFIPEGNAISFAPSISVAVSRGVPVTDDNFSAAFLDFGVYAVGGEIEMANQQVVRSGEVWNYEPKQNWTGDDLTFYAYAPYATDANGIEPVSCDLSGGLKVKYTMPEAVADQPDLTWAKPDTQSEGTVNLSFAHALSAIGFKIKGDTKCKLKAIGIQGVDQSGELCVTSAGASYWVNSKELGDTKFLAGLNGELIPPTSANEATSVMASNGYIMMIPQAIPASSNLMVTILNKDDRELTARFKFPEGSKWEANKRYTYTVTLNSSQIAFGEVMVEPWDENVDVEFDEDGNPIVPTDKYVTQEEYTDKRGNFDEEMLIETYKAIEAAGITEIIYTGAFMPGMLGPGIDMEDEDSMFAITNPQQKYAPSVTKLDFRGVEGLVLPMGAFINGVDFNEETNEMVSRCNVSEVLLPDYITELPIFAFAGTKLSEYENSNIERVGETAFALIPTLTKLSLPNANYIGEYAFMLTQLSTLELTATGDIEIREGAFEDAETEEDSDTDMTYCDLVLNVDKLNGVAGPVANGNEWAGYKWKSITYHLASGEPVDAIVDLDIHDSVEKLNAALQEKYDKGIRKFEVVGTYFDGALGSDYICNIIGDGEPDPDNEIFKPSDSPFASTARPEVLEVDLSGVTDMTRLPGKAFSDVDGVEELDVRDDGVVPALKIVKLPSSVTEIGDMAFLGAQELELVEMPGDNIALGRGLFTNPSGNDYDSEVAHILEIRFTSPSGDVTLAESGESFGTFDLIYRDYCRLVFNRNNTTLYDATQENVLKWKGSNWGSILLVDDDGEYVYDNGVIDFNLLNSNELFCGFLFNNKVKEQDDYYVRNFIAVGKAYPNCLLKANTVVNDEGVVYGRYECYDFPEAPNDAYYSNDLFNAFISLDLSRVECRDSESCKEWLQPGQFTRYGNLEKIILPYDLNEIPDAMFADVSSLTTVVASGVSKVGNNAFGKASNLTTFDINGNALEEVGAFAFRECSQLASVPLSTYSVHEIKQKTFYKCEALTDIALDNVKYIGTSAFEGCTLLSTFGGYGGTNISAVQIEDRAFYGCSSLSSVSIRPYDESGEYSEAYIGEKAFSNCGALETVTVQGLAEINFEIGKMAFSSEFYETPIIINSVNISNVDVIGESAFADCELLDTLILTAEDGYPTVIGDKAFAGNEMLSKSYVSIVNLECVSSIGDSAFANCDNLENVAFSSNLTSIGDSAFKFCEKLHNVRIPNSVTELGAKAFYHCLALSSVTLSSQLTEIKDYTFQSCGTIYEMRIPANVTSIGEEAMLFTTFNKLYIGCPGDVLLGESAFHNTASTDLYVCNHLSYGSWWGGYTWKSVTEQ